MQLKVIIELQKFIFKNKLLKKKKKKLVPP